MTAAGRGIRNAFRNAVRAVSVVVILGLAMGLGRVMLIASHSVTGQVATTLSSIGNTVAISPPLYSVGGQPARNLTTAELAPIAHLHAVTSIDETLHGSAQPRGQTRNATPGTPARTSLRPVNSSAAVYLAGSTQPTNPANIGRQRSRS